MPRRRAARRFRRYSQSTYTYGEYVPVRERERRAKAAKAEAARKGRTLRPVVIQGRTIARSTWGRAWCGHIESFHDFTAYCCSNHTCGPHMGKACERMQLAVKERRLRDETLRQELVIEMERRRKLQEIYEGRRDLQIEIEPASKPVTSGQRP